MAPAITAARHVFIVIVMVLSPGLMRLAHLRLMILRSIRKVNALAKHSQLRLSSAWTGQKRLF